MVCLLYTSDIPVQRKACREFAERMGWTIVYEEQENGVSGFKVSANDRDKIQLIKEYAEQGKFDILLVFMFDRIGRRAEETPFVVEWLINHGIQVWSVNEGEQQMCIRDREASLRNTEDSDAIISGLLKGAAEFYGASRASVVEADWDLGIGVITYEWCKDGDAYKRQHPYRLLRLH